MLIYLLINLIVNNSTARIIKKVMRLAHIPVEITESVCQEIKVLQDYILISCPAGFTLSNTKSFPL